MGWGVVAHFHGIACLLDNKDSNFTVSISAMVRWFRVKMYRLVACSPE